MTHERKRFAELAFVVLLLIFAALKLPTISTPYFWDELGVYVPGALKMKDNGTIGLLPANLEPLYSRGHPLLFVFSQASWFYFIGETPAAGHAFSILLGLATLAVFFWCVRNLWGAPTALMASLLLMVQPLFFAMAGVILPEMMLTLFTIPAIWAVIRERWWIFAIAASLALMTKESAIVIPPVALMVIFIDSIREKKIFASQTFGKYCLAAVPFFVYGIFLLIQKKQNGWYFFPEHMGYLRRDLSFFHQLVDITREIFFSQGKIVIGIFTVSFLIYVNIRKTAEQRAVNISVLFIVVCIGFSALNFYLSRYMLFALPFVILTGAGGAWHFLQRWFPRWRYVTTGSFITVCVVLSLAKMDTGKFNDTADMSYLQLVRTKQQAIDWLEQQPWRDSVIEANFPIFQALTDMRNGYLSVRPFEISVNYEKKAAYGLWFHFKEDDPIVWDGRSYTVINRWKTSYAYISAVKY